MLIASLSGKGKLFQIVTALCNMQFLRKEVSGFYSIRQLSSYLGTNNNVPW
jgi:hypothetical protein